MCIYLYNRVIRYFYQTCDSKTPQRIWNLRDYEELFSTKFNLSEDYRRFRNVEKNWWSLVLFTHWSDLRFSKRKSFSVFPIFHPGSKNQQYNVMALFELLRGSRKSKIKQTLFHRWQCFNMNHNRCDSVNPEFNVIIPYRGLTAGQRRFTTNGVVFLYHDEPIWRRWHIYKI